MVSVIAVRASVTILAVLLWTAPALAQRSGGHGHGPVRAQVMPGRPAMPSHPIARPPSLLPGNGHHWQHHGGFGRRGFVGGGPVVLYAPPVYGGSMYGEPASYYGTPPPPSYSYVPAYAPTYDNAPSLALTPPTPTVIEHPTGRYELRGDGLTAPYRWVWVPHPPSTPPPSPAPVVAEPAPSRSATTVASEAPPRRSKLYKWKDDEGVMHWTDDVTTVPPELRSKAEVRSY